MSTKGNHTAADEKIAKPHVRTIKIPVASVIEGGTTQQFYSDLRDSLRQCVAAFNRCLTECAVLDREAHVTGKVGKCPKTYTYPVISGRFEGNCSIAATLSRSAESAYREKRFQIITGRASLPVQRSCPMPLLHNKSNKSFSIDCDGESVVLTLKLLSGTRWRVQLRGGSNYARQLRTLRDCASRDAIGDSKVWIDNRGCAVFGIACRLERKSVRNASGTLHVCTARDAFVVAVKEQNDTPFTINADHVKRWQLESARRKQRLNQDRKSGQSRRYVKGKQFESSIKYRHKMNSFTHEAASHIVEHARRRRIARLEYDGTIRSYFGGDFPWFEFEQKLQQKCEIEGIEFVKVTREIIPADLDEPHVYFVTPIVDGKVNGRVKIGMTTQQGGKRKKSLEMAGGCDELLVLATVKVAQSKLRQVEKKYHAQFAEYRVDGQVEWFRSEPIISYLREVGCLGNAGNLSQITQYMEA